MTESKLIVNKYVAQVKDNLVKDVKAKKELIDSLDCKIAKFNNDIKIKRGIKSEHGESAGTIAIAKHRLEKLKITLEARVEDDQDIIDSMVRLTLL